MSELPKGWTACTLGSLMSGIHAGLNITCEERPPEAGEKGLVKISAVSWGRFNQDQSKTFLGNSQPEDRNRIQCGDLLISRANTIELVGSSVIVGELTRELYLSDKVLRLVVHESSKRWINYALKTATIRKFIESSSSGNQLSMRNISQENLKALPLPLAPEAEQRRIADKLDTVLARVDDVSARLARVAPLLKRFRQSVLAAATSGSLTEEWRAERKLACWTSTSVGALIQGIEAGLNVKCDERPPEEGEKGLVKISAVTWGIFNECESKTLPGSAAVAEAVRIKEGDFLISRANTLELVGACVIVHAVERSLYLSDKVLRLVMLEKLRPWLLFVLRSDFGRKQIQASASGNQLSMRNLSQANIRAIEVPMPSDDEMAEVTRRVELLFAFADRLEARLSAAQTATQRLTPALLAKAFRGELVPQDPNDEPAAELLKRLAAQREAAPAKTRNNKKIGSK